MAPAQSKVVALLMSVWLGAAAATRVAESAVPGVNVELLVDGGFEAATGTAAPGWRWQGRAAITSNGPHAGKSCAVVEVPAGVGSSARSGFDGVFSPRIAYHGGRIKFTGWVKLRDVKTGSKPWHKAAVQFFTHDRTGQAAGHHDLFLKDGTSDWQPIEQTVLFSREIAAIELRAGLWGDAAGAVWIDDLSISYLDDPARFARSFDRERALVDVDAGGSLGPLPRTWRATDVCWMDRAVHPVMVQSYPLLREAGIRCMRLHGCVNPREVVMLMTGAHSRAAEPPRILSVEQEAFFDLLRPGDDCTLNVDQNRSGCYLALLLGNLGN